MKLVYNKKAKDPFYYIQHGYRVGKKVNTITVCKIGRHSELLKTHDDPLEYALSVLKNYKDDYENSQKAEKGKKLPKTKDVASKSNEVNIGYFYLQDIYSKLKLKELFDEISIERKFTFNLNDIVRFLTFDRILNPKSKLATTKNLDFYYEKPTFSHQNVLRGMDVLSENYDKYINHLFTESNNIVKRDTSVCYYDCTNYYFEIENADETYIDDVTGEVLYGLRQYGPSKEHRPNPIVEMGLFMDKDGIPITMGIFPGNTNEQKTVAPLENKMIRNLKNKKLIYCGDAGLGSASIRTFNDMGGRAFIVTQSIKKLSKELQDELLEDRNFRLLSNNEPISLNQLKDFDKCDPKNARFYQDKAYKSIVVDSNVNLGLVEEKTLKNGKTKLVKSKAVLQQTIIVTYSRKMAEYQKNIRNKQVERAMSLLSRGVDDVRKGPNDVARFIKKVNDDKICYAIDEERIASEERLDGFYAIATNLNDDDAKDIIEINEQRYKIEDCFRVLKTNFDARPVYHRLDNRITAHFMVCYSSLLIYRLLEKKLHEKGYHFTINEIISTIKNIKVYPDESKYNSLFTNSRVLESLIDTMNIDLDAEYFKPTYLSKIIKKIS